MEYVYIIDHFDGSIPFSSAKKAARDLIRHTHDGYVYMMVDKKEVTTNSWKLVALALKRDQIVYDTPFTAKTEDREWTRTAQKRTVR